MQENEFEKKVQEQLDELQLRPSDTVWAGVEKELQKKKKRRVIVFFSLLAGLSLLGYLTYTIVSGNSYTTITTAQQKSNPSTADLPILKEKTTPIVTDDKTDNKKTDPPTTIGISSNQRKEITENKVLYSYQSAKAGTKNELIVTQTSPLPVNKERAMTSTIDQRNTTTDKEKIGDSLAASIAMKKDSVVKTELTDKPDAVATTQKKTTKKIKWGFDFSIGENFSRNNLFSPIPQNDPVQLNFAFMNPSSTTGFPPSGYIKPPLVVKAGVAFKIGTVAEMALTKKSSVTAGLHYAYLSEKIKAGTSLYSGAYGIPQKDHTNSYHFIELPLSYQLQLNRGKKIALLWNAGLSVNYLVASNALVYDTAAGGIYYKNKEAYNKLHVALNTGLSFRFGNNKKMQWSIGPELSMDMTGLMKENPVVRKRYLMYGGVTAKFFLKKK